MEILTIRSPIDARTKALEWYKKEVTRIIIVQELNKIRKVEAELRELKHRDQEDPLQPI